MELRRNFPMSHLPFSYEVAGDFIRPFVLGTDDAAGDSLATLGQFSEMRGHYWLWRNMKFDSDEFVSTQQYRRAFFWSPLMTLGGNYDGEIMQAAKNLHQQIIYMPRQKYIAWLQYLSDADKEPLNHWLDGVDIVIGRPIEYPVTIAQVYGQHHRAVDWEIFASECRKQGYDDGNHRMLTGHLMYAMRPYWFNRWMTGWWSVFGKIAPLLEPVADSYQSRQIGYLSERFLSAWLIRMRTESPSVRIQTLPIVESLFQFDRPAPGVM